MTHRHRPFPRKALSSSTPRLEPYHLRPIEPARLPASLSQMAPFLTHRRSMTAPFLTDRRLPSVALPQSKLPASALPFHNRRQARRRPGSSSQIHQQSPRGSAVGHPRGLNPRYAPDHPFTCARPIRTRSRPAPGRSARAALVPLTHRGHQCRHVSLTHTTILPLPQSSIRHAHPLLSPNHYRLLTAQLHPNQTKQQAQSSGWMHIVTAPVPPTLHSPCRHYFTCNSLSILRCSRISIFSYGDVDTYLLAVQPFHASLRCIPLP